MPDEIKRASLEEDSLIMHASGRPGKLEIAPTKPLITQRDLSLAYSPGVAAPCLKIAEDPDTVFDYTARGNMVAIISNGTAVLGLGNIGAAASKPVMEGKAVLFKRFADIDGIDLEVDTEDVDAMINAVRYLGPSFGGINLEDIRAPDCFIIEQRLRELMDIPVFHDDQHGTAIVSAAGLINALALTDRSMRDVKVVSNGAGAASIACIELMKAMGVAHENVILCDREGRDLSGPRDRHEPVEIRPCRADKGAYADRSNGRLGRISRLVGGRLRDWRDGQVDERQAHHFRDGQPKTRNIARGGTGSAPRCNCGDWPVRLPKSDQQRAGLSLYFPRRAGRTCAYNQRADENSRRRGYCGNGPRGCS